jgi:hypothetical protein
MLKLILASMIAFGAVAFAEGETTPTETPAAPTTAPKAAKKTTKTMKKKTTTTTTDKDAK